MSSSYSSMFQCQNCKRKDDLQPGSVGGWVSQWVSGSLCVTPYSISSQLVISHSSHQGAFHPARWHHDGSAATLC